MIKLLSLLVTWCALLGVSSTASHADTPTLRKEMAYRVQASSAKDVALLLPSLSSLNITDASGWPLLSIAAARTDAQALPIVQTLVEAGADVNFGGPQKLFPLITAVSGENVPIVAYLLDQKADYQAKNMSGITASQLINQGAQTEMTALLSKRIQKDQSSVMNAHSQENLNQLSYALAYHSCAMQYYSYYYNSEQDEVPQSTQQQTIATHKQEVSLAMTGLAQLFQLSKDLSTKLFMSARQSIFNELEKLVSNRYRRAKGVGKSSDMEKRCTAIAEPYRKNHFNKEQLMLQAR